MQKVNPKFYLTADEAASDLGISVSSLYAYVSRGFIKSQSLENSRKKGYLRSDIESLKRKKKGFKDDPNFVHPPNLKDSAITKITEMGPLYRGVNAISLARTESVESVACLLWQTDLSVFDRETSFDITPTFKALRKSFSRLNPLAQYASLAASIEQESPKAYNLTPVGAARTSVDVTRWLASLIAESGNYPKNMPIHKYIAAKGDLAEGYAELLRALLVLVADHEQGPASQVARNSAYAGNTPYGVVCAALIAWQGSHMMKGIGQPMMQFMAEMMNTPDPTLAITNRLQDGASLPGVGSPVYGAKDPRGVLLIELAKEYLPDDCEARKFCLAADIIEDLTGKSPSLVVTAAFLARKLKMPNQIRTLIALGRCVGWLAHAMEVYDSNTPLEIQ